VGIEWITWRPKNDTKEEVIEGKWDNSDESEWPSKITTVYSIKRMLCVSYQDWVWIFKKCIGGRLLVSMWTFKENPKVNDDSGKKFYISDEKSIYQA